MSTVIEDVLTFAFVDSPGPASAGRKAPPWKYKTGDGTQFKSWNAMGVAPHLPYRIKWEEKENKLGGTELWILSATPYREGIPGVQKANGSSAPSGNSNKDAERGGIYHDIVPLLAQGKAVTEVVDILVKAHHAYEAYKAALAKPEVYKEIKEDFNDSLDDTF